MGIKRCIGGLLLLAGAFLSCQSEETAVGLSLVGPDEVQVQVIDSVTIRTSTVLVPDSFVTSADTNVLIGQWSDALTGRATARGFASFDYAANELANTSGLRLDSLVLELGYTFAYGDTTARVDLALHRLQAPLAEQTYDNTDAVAYETVPLFQRTLLPRPNSGTRQLRFRMPDNLALSFWNGLLTRQIVDAATLADFWKGIALTGATSGNVFVGFAAGQRSGLRLYYHATDISGTATSLQFPLQGTHFTQLTADRSGTPLQSLRQRADAVSSGLTDRSSFVAMGVGLRTRIEFPYLGQFEKPERFIGLNHAELVLEPMRRTDRDNMAPPATLALYQTNSQNELLAEVPGGPTGSSGAVAAYSIDPTSLELTDGYRFDLSQYISQVIRRQITNRALLLTAPAAQPDLTLLVRRVTLGDGQRPTDRMRLRLYLTTGS
ncbi:DUF4270 family protein [Tellurirhabdus rosea]|uniref:DUF4270 family protein n=1 Tax=Tellurirhabdus rosea TaxID=2674997 RepID=UPI0022534500|nr:DUF4270 family protein [Tellurirhabdus rosea]